MSLPRMTTCFHCGSPPNFGPYMVLPALGPSVAALERIRVAFQALRDGKDHASSKLYRVLAAEFPAKAALSGARTANEDAATKAMRGEFDHLDDDSPPASAEPYRSSSKGEGK